MVASVSVVVLMHQQTSLVVHVTLVHGLSVAAAVVITSSAAVSSEAETREIAIALWLRRMGGTSGHDVIALARNI